MLRLYHFDLDRNSIDVETLSPWALAPAVAGAQRARGPGGPAHHHGGPVCRAHRFRDTPPGARQSDYAPSQPGHGSLYFNGAQNGEYPLQGAYFTTGAKAPLNTETFPSGFTFEVYVKIPLDWSPDDNAWMAVLSRWGRERPGRQAGREHRPEGADHDVQLLR